MHEAGALVNGGSEVALLERDLTYALRGCFFDVHRQIGLGLPEQAYHRGLKRALIDAGISAQDRPNIPLLYDEQQVVHLVPDFVVAERVIVEIKAVRRGFAREHYVQLYSYLKATGIRLGMLVNFGGERVVVERRVFDAKPLTIEEDWTAVKGKIDGTEKHQLHAVRNAILDVSRQSGLGFSEPIYQQLFCHALLADKHEVNPHPFSQPKYNGTLLGHFQVNCILVDNAVPAIITALHDEIDSFDVAQAASIAHNLKLRHAIVANFGKTKLEIMAVVDKYQLPYDSAR